MKKACWNSQPSLSALSPVTSGEPQDSGRTIANAFSSSSSPSCAVAAVTECPPEGSARVAVLIPAYRPGLVLVDTVKLLATGGFDAIVVVDDGSGAGYAPIFAEISRIPNVDVVSHAINMGKGSALKAGINFVLYAYPEISGIVTADADGQHDPADVQKVSARFQANPDSLVLGVRDFLGRVPLRSRLGNRITRRIVRAVIGHNLSDSQTGLRAIPRMLLPRLLKMRSAGYEFELEMLIAAKHLGLQVVEQPIRTIYEPGNPSSHFQPFRDSMRIYNVLLRFTSIGILTAALDNLVFYFLFQATGSILESQVGARSAAVLFNYTAVRRAVFLSDERHGVLLPRYLLVVLANAGLSYAGIQALTSLLHLSVFPAKIIAETLLFVVNFLAQRDFVFTKRAGAPSVTDWDRYYQHVPFTARFTRKYTESVLISTMRMCTREGECGTILEIGGANSCFVEAILRVLRPTTYHVVDRNKYGLLLLKHRFDGRHDVILHEGDVLELQDLNLRADVVFSIGLIEHFDPEGTHKAIQAHFDLLRPGGLAIISFPTPTWLYIVTRAIAEVFGMWHFPDERPLMRSEVRAWVGDAGEIVFEKSLWPLVLTQHLIAVRKSHG